jgi:integrase
MYRRSPKWAALSLKTRAQYERDLDYLGDDRPVALVDRPYIMNWVGDIGRRSPSQANQFLASVSAFLSWCVVMEIIPANPCQGLTKFKLGEWKRWPEHVVKDMIDNGSPTTRLAVALAYYTGQRRGDIARMRWENFEGDGVRVHQGKTGELLYIPISRDLELIIAQYRREKGPVFEPFGDGNRIYEAVRSDLKKLGHDLLPFHGLRKSAAANLAESGATDREIMSVTGHRTNAMIGLYTRQAEQKRLARAAIDKMDMGV